MSFCSSFMEKIKRESPRVTRCRILHKGRIPWGIYPHKWVILSCFMLSGNVSLPHSAHTIFEMITDTVSRIRRVHDLVEVSLPVIQQYQFIRYNEFKSLNTLEPISIDT